MSRTSRLILPSILLSLCVTSASAQSGSAPSVSQVLIYSGVSSPSIPVLNASGSPNGSVTLQRAVPNIFSGSGNLAGFGSNPFGAPTDPTLYGPNSGVALISGILNQSIATALSVIPISSPASGVITKTDPLTGGEIPASGTLGPIFTERAETIGKNKFYIGISHQDYHFTSYNGNSLNNLTLVYQGNESTKLSAPGVSSLDTYPVSYSVGVDVRLSQDIAFLSYGVTNRFDVSVGLPVVHAAVAARMYNGISWEGSGTGNLDKQTNTSGLTPNCWCSTSLAPGNPVLQVSDVGNSSLSKTGFGDMILRAKGTVLDRPNAVIAVGADVRLPTGDEQNFLGAGAASFKPFVAVSLYSKPLSNNVVFSPHATLGWQVVGKSVLGGTLVPTLQTANTASGPISYYGAPFTSTKDFLPDVLSWSVGAEVALGRHNTVAVDILGNQIGLMHGILNTQTNKTAMGFAPCGNTVNPNCTNPLQVVPGLISAGRTSMGQYTGSFGYKARIVGNLVAMFNILIRFDNNGLVSRFVPLYGIGYSFGR